MQTKTHFPMLLVVLAAAAALTFGTSEVMAANAAMTCVWDPPTRLGECISDGQCMNLCLSQPGADASSQGICNAGNCCICYL